jgi:hypothetical protein
VKKLLFIPIICALVSCSSIESDAEKTCQLMTEMTELMPEVMKLSMQSALGSETEMKEASDKLTALEIKFEEIGDDIEKISSKYDEDEFQNYLLDNCEVARNIKNMGEAFEGLGNLE